jgi:hypothetical protein
MVVPADHTDNYDKDLVLPGLAKLPLKYAEEELTCSLYF